MGNDGRCPILQHRHLESAGGFHNILAAKLPLALAPVHTCVAALPLALLVRPRLPRDRAALARFHALLRLAHGRYVIVLLVCLRAHSSTRARPPLRVAPPPWYQRFIGKKSRIQNSFLFVGNPYVFLVISTRKQLVTENLQISENPYLFLIVSARNFGFGRKPSVCLKIMFFLIGSGSKLGFGRETPILLLG